MASAFVQPTGVFHFSRKTATKIVEIFYNSTTQNHFIQLIHEFDEPALNIFTKGALENIFKAIQTIENEENSYDENEEICILHYGFRQIEIMRLFYAMRNYHLIHTLANLHFSKSYSALYLFCDISEDNDECSSCGWSQDKHFYYSKPEFPNVPVCTQCFYSNSTVCGSTLPSTVPTAPVINNKYLNITTQQNIRLPRITEYNFNIIS